MKRIIALVLALMLLAALAGCQQSGTDGTMLPTTGAPSQQQSTVPTTQGGGADLGGTITEAMVRNHAPTPENQFRYTEVAGGVEVYEYLGTDSIVVIPETIAGKKVVKLGGYLFANKSPVRGVYIPDGIDELVSTFINNDKVELVICEGVSLIGIYTFLNCPNLHTVKVSDRLTTIGQYAFSMCTGLVKLYLPESVTVMSEDAEDTVFIMSDNLTVQGQTGSFIESYCAKYNIPFEAV